MARLSDQGQMTTLALIAEQYAQIVDLREALNAERAAHAETRQRLAEATEDDA